MLLQLGARATVFSALFSSVVDMSPRKVASKELLEVNVDEDVEVTRPNVPIYVGTQWFIDNATQVTWRKYITHSSIRGFIWT